MYKKPTKKQLVIRRVIFAAAATLSVLVIVTITILFMLGYRLDSENRRLEQGALLQFDSQPTGADVYIDGKFTGNRTTTKQTVIAGEHIFEMKRAGYEDWRRTLTLKAGTLTWLDYIRLVPVSRDPTEVLAYTALADMVAAPDKKVLLVQESTASPTFQLVDISAERVKTTPLSLPEDLFTKPANPETAHQFNIKQWNIGSRYVSVQHVFGDQSEWLVLDTQDIAQSVNVSRALSVNIADLKFTGSNGKVFFALATDGVLRKLDVGSGTISRGLVTNVESFTTDASNTISYVGRQPDDTEVRVAGVYRDGDESSHVLFSRRDANAAIPLYISYGRYFSSDYVAIAADTELIVLKGSYPTSSDVTATSLAPLVEIPLSQPATSLSFSPAYEYIIAQSGTAFVSYEIEHERTAKGTIGVPEGAAASQLTWLDAAYLWDDNASTLTMRDFDNANVYAIMPVAQGFDVTLSQNGRFMYAIGKTEAGYNLQRVKMILD